MQTPVVRATVYGRKRKKTEENGRKRTLAAKNIAATIMVEMRKAASAEKV